MYIANRPSYKMEETGTGLNYYIYSKTIGPLAESGREAGIYYTISFLNGTKCYSIDSTSTEFHKIDHSELEDNGKQASKEYANQYLDKVIPKEPTFDIQYSGKKTPTEKNTSKDKIQTKSPMSSIKLPPKPATGASKK